MKIKINNGKRASIKFLNLKEIHLYNICVITLGGINYYYRNIKFLIKILKTVTERHLLLHE